MPAIQRQQPKCHIADTAHRSGVRCGHLDCASMPGYWQLLDRPAEHAAIRSALSSSDSCGVVLVGAAGVGKTTLARTVTSSMEKKVHWTACTESSRSIPLGAFASWVRPSASRDPIALLGSARESLVA